MFDFGYEFAELFKFFNLPRVQYVPRRVNLPGVQYYTMASQYKMHQNMTPQGIIPLASQSPRSIIPWLVNIKCTKT